ncbi:MAG: hypothetical protein L3J35_12740 [Bacteroidales bacterium]|nr:hypothetical protein [Bacteroidales bacterium]
MEDNYAEIIKLKSLIERILSLYEKKKETTNGLLIQNKELKEQIEQKEKQIKELKNKTETLKIAKTISLTEEDKTEVKNKINKIVREIDRSIGLLNE